MATLPDFWINSEIAPFLHSGTEHLYLGRVTIEKIWWQEPEHARLLLMGPMPDAVLLFSLKDGDSILLLRKECGPSDTFFVDEVVMACHDCQIRRKWFLNLSPNFEEQEVVCIYASLDCRFEIVDREGIDA